MRAEPEPMDREPREPAMGFAWYVAAALAGLIGLVLLADALDKTSATYDEVAYLRIAARWWRTGEQDAITRMGSPLTFWKLQQVPLLWILGHTGRHSLIDDPIASQAALLPLARGAALWIWLAAFVMTAAWSRQLYGPRAMALAAWLFALEPNLLAHGGLITMELPLVACTTAMFYAFWRFVQKGERRAFWVSAAIGGIGFSCKYTTVLVPPVLGILWWIDLRRRAERGIGHDTVRVAAGMVGYVAVLLACDVLITGCAVLPLSQARGPHPVLESRFGARTSNLLGQVLEMPLPQDWVGFATQVLHQRSGGPSYLLGERRMHGWWYYYFVALAVKLPLSFGMLVLARLGLAVRRQRSVRGDWMLPAFVALFLAITALGSSRNYGVRYLLPLAPPAIVWISRLGELGRWPGRLAVVGVLAQTLAVASIHPYELSYFNALAGGALGGRRVLADSNLDWGQGLRSLAQLQRDHPELADMTLYYFGDTEPRHYGVRGTAHVIDASDRHPGLPARLSAATVHVAVSASLQWGPWGPAGYFEPLEGVAPLRLTDDGTIAIYRWPPRRSRRQ